MNNRQLIAVSESIKEANAAHHAHLAQLRNQRKNRDLISKLFDFDACISRARAEQEAAMKRGELRGLPSCFGELA